MQASGRTTSRVIRKLRAEPCIRIILAFGLLLPASEGHQPPPNLAKRVAQRETEAREARAQYMYRQSVTLKELGDKGGQAGEYREVREVIFSPIGERTERFLDKPFLGLRRLQLTAEDFRDIREVQPFLFTADQLWMYVTRFRGEEEVDGVQCWVLEVRPRQILQGQRLFDGLLWVSKQDEAVVRSEGKAVPEIRTSKSENLFPRFTTLRQAVDGRYWFPIHTHADDMLEFRSGPIRVQLTIRYSDYQRFGAESTVRFEKGK